MRIGWEVAAAVSISTLRNAAATQEERVRKVSAFISLSFVRDGVIAVGQPSRRGVAEAQRGSDGRVASFDEGLGNRPRRRLGRRNGLTMFAARKVNAGSRPA
jgi:hypothetical protein